MYDWQDFNTVFKGRTDYSFDQKQVETIQRNRNECGGTLFFDRVWLNVGLRQPTKHYPPKSNAEFRNLWKKLAEASFDDTSQQALLFYILNDRRTSTSTHGSSPHLGHSFASKVHLPEKYRIFTIGLWELDQAHFSRALEYLTHPSVLPSSFADEILLTLVRHPKCDDNLAMAYALTVEPPLKTTEAVEAYFDLITTNNVVEAYHFAAGQEHSQHQALFQRLIRSVLSLPTSDSEIDVPTRADRIILLASLPLSHTEESWLESYLLTDPQGSKLPQAKDLVLARRIALGKEIDGVAGTLDRHRGMKHDGMNWDDLRISLKKAAEG